MDKALKQKIAACKSREDENAPVPEFLTQSLRPVVREIVDGWLDHNQVLVGRVWKLEPEDLEDLEDRISGTLGLLLAKALAFEGGR